MGLGFLCLPQLIQISGFFFELGYFYLNQIEALLGGIVFFAAHSFALDLELNQATIKLVHHFRLGIDFNFDFGGGLVDEINRFIGQEAI